jgi:serine/threonine-protein kinase HipA
MKTREAVVYFKDEIVGSLKENTSGNTIFEYNKDWNKESIACTLPIHKRIYEWERGLHPFFENLGTEGWLRDVRSSKKLSTEDDFGHLLKYGADCIGAVSLIDPSQMQKETDTSFHSNSEEEKSINSPRTMSGVHKKLFVYKHEKEYHPAGSLNKATHIAKFEDSNTEDLVKNEKYTLQLAQSILGKDRVTQFETNFINNKLALVVKRFDRGPDFSKLRMEEFAQILNKPIGKDQLGKYNGSYEEIGKAIKIYSCLPIIDLMYFYKLVIFNMIVGNCDAHLKNFALVETANGMRLSPAYDLLNSLIYKDKFDSNIGLSLGGEKCNIDRINKNLIIDFGINIGLKIKAINQIFNEMKRKFSKNPLLVPPKHEPIDGFYHNYEYIVRSACHRILEA